MEAQKTMFFLQEIGACIKDQERWATGENCLSWRDGTKGPIGDTVDFECRVRKGKVSRAQVCGSGLATWKAQLSLMYVILN